MTEQTDKLDLQFYQLVISLHAAAMQQMGKFASPLTGKVERDLAQASSSIEMLDMLKSKTNGNLTEEEKKLLDHLLYELRMNFVDETKKGDVPEPSSEGSEAAESETDSKTESSAEGDEEKKESQGG